MKAIILAAGLGSRLRPLTNDIPKPLVPFVNTPLLDYHINFLKSYGIDELAINLHYLPDKIRQHINKLDTPESLKIRYSWEGDLLGTGGGIKKMANLLSRDTIVILNSDILINFDLSAAIAFHKKNKALATMVLNPYEPLGNRKGVAIDSQNRIRQVADAPDCAEADLKQLMFAGIHIIEPELTEYIQDDNPSCINADVYPLLIKMGMPVYGYVLPKDCWRHVGTAESYLLAHNEFMDAKLPFEIPLAQDETRIWKGDNVFISLKARLIPPVILGSHTTLEAKSIVGPYTVLGEGCRIGEEASISHSVLWDGVQIGAGSRLNKCVTAADTVIDSFQMFDRQLIASGQYREF